jgi:hypothetical protein
VADARDRAEQVLDPVQDLHPVLSFGMPLPSESRATGSTPRA